MSTPPFDTAQDPFRLLQDTMAQWQAWAQPLMDQQQAAFQRQAEAFQAQANTFAQQQTESFAAQAEAAQQVLRNLTDAFGSAWQEVPFRVAAGEDMVAILDGYQAQLKQAAEQVASAAGQAQDQWKQYAQQLWQGVGAWAGTPTPAAGWPAGADPLRLLDSPALGLVREYQEAAAPGVQAAQDYAQAEGAYAQVLARIWGTVFTRFGQDLATRATQGQPFEGVRDASRAWARTVDAVFVEAFRGDDYVAAQQRYLEAGLRLRQQRRTLLEVILRANDLPTLADVDDLAQTVYQLRRDHRNAQRTVDAQAETIAALNEQVAQLRATAARQHEALAVLTEQVARLDGQHTDVHDRQGHLAAKQMDLEAAYTKGQDAAAKQRAALRKDVGQLKSGHTMHKKTTAALKQSTAALTRRVATLEAATPAG